MSRRFAVPPSIRSGAARSGRFPLLCALVAGLGLVAAPASAQSCWQVTGWAGMGPGYTPSLGDIADLEAADCTIVPEGWGWAQVFLSIPDPGPEDLHIRVRNTGPLIDGWTGTEWATHVVFVFEGEDGAGVPQIRLDAFACLGCPIYDPLVPWPPRQAAKFWLLDKRVRLRHARTNLCLYITGPNNGPVQSKPCAEDPEQTFVLDHLGSGTVRLRHESDDQCLYTQDFDNATVHHWGCSLSAVQRFDLAITPLAGGGFRLENIERGQCPYGNPSPGDEVRSWSCWNSENQVFKIDLLE
ncbi:MAG: hypothetical protein AAGF23_12340 [Acidobacteriota bacterium]